MDEQLREVLNLVRRTARQAGDTAADAAYGAGKKAEELLSVARVRAKIAGLEGDVRGCLQDAGGLLYATHTGTPTDSEVLLAKLEEIDRINILRARLLAMERAIQGLSRRPDLALVDGNRSEGITVPCRTVVKGDRKSASIAAASILAKVSRDRYMGEMAAVYPVYGFERHKGYPTQLHYQRLRQYGPCPIHRRTFLKKL